MQKIDRLGWAAGLAFTSFGTRVGIRVNGAPALERVTDYLPPGWKRSTSPVVDSLYSLIDGSEGTPTQINGGPHGLRRYNLLYVGTQRLARSMEIEEVLDTLRASLQASVALRAAGWLFVRAGVVSWHGRAVVILGRRGAGTSSLVAALVRAGATYFSDSFAVFDAWGRVHAFRTPLALRHNGDERGSRVHVDEAVGRREQSSVPLGLVIATAYRPRIRWEPRVLSPGQAVLGLFEHTVVSRERPAFALRVLQRSVAGAQMLRGARGEASDLVALLMNHMNESLAQPNPNSLVAGSVPAFSDVEGLC